MNLDTETQNVWEGRLFSNGWRVGSAGTITVTAPGTGELVGTVGRASTDDLDRAVAAATRAQREWAARSYEGRAQVLLAAARLLNDAPRRLSDILVPESGSIQLKASIELAGVAGELQEAAALASHPSGEILRSSRPRMSLARRVPIGVIGVIAPFNFPSVLAMRSVAPALALGNAVILKPDPRTPISGGLALAALLEEAGLPEGVLHVLPGGGDLGAALVAHPGVPCVCFTGSTAAGRTIGEAAGRLLKRVHLELGGNNALLVLPDADVSAAAGAGMFGSFVHQGQICMTSGRHLVHRSVADGYVAALAEKAALLPVGDPADPRTFIGPLIDESQRDRVHGIVTSAIEAGATLVTGGTYEGLYYRPTVLTDLAPDNPAWSQEIFGPVAPVMVYDEIDEAIEIINASEYGLSVGILTSDAYRAYELCDRIVSGAVHINDQTVDDEVVIPFGGVKASGVGGRLGGPHANLDTFTQTQWVTMQTDIERYPF